MANRLAKETSPYLLQHAHNPVDWWAWSNEALAAARELDRPILLSIGYAACHWCHVMERESFENAQTADVMNANFVCIKVDREERPDLDAIYMQATQAMTGHGGWPMTVFLTPAGEPFFAGTYFPPDDRQGMPSFTRVLRGIAATWATKRDTVAQTTAQMRELLTSQNQATGSTGTLTADLLARATTTLKRQYEPRHGGFGGAPKFPPTMTLDFALRQAVRTDDAQLLGMVLHTFREMASGGIYDQIGGGFARYSVDAKWLVPHFEKMLYDNALLVRLGAHLWQQTSDLEIRRVTEQTLAWLAREMTSAEGGFYSSLDADSEGHEGLFYVWTHAEFTKLLGADAQLLCDYWGVTEGGNFEGSNILNVVVPIAEFAALHGVSEFELREAIERATRILMNARDKRVRPGLDDKILVAWNGLMLRGVSECARVFQDDDLAALALRNAEFLFSRMVKDGRVFRSYRNGLNPIGGFLEDYAALGLAAVSMYQLTFDDKWLRRAHDTGKAMLELFWDAEQQTFFDTARDAEPLVIRPRDVTDNAMPSGTSLAVELLLILGDLFDESSYRTKAEQLLETIAEPMSRYPAGFGHALGAAELAIRGAVEVAIAGDPADEAFRELTGIVAGTYVPSLILAGGAADDSIALLRDRAPDDVTAYVCHGYTCDAPTTSARELSDQLADAVKRQQA